MKFYPYEKGGAVKVLASYGALDGGSPVSPVDFKKWQCPLSLFLKFPCRFLNSPMSPVDFKKWQCPLSLILKSPCRF